jgi:hypothetical protein
LAFIFDAVKPYRGLVTRLRSNRLDSAQIILRRNAYKAAVAALALGRPVAWRTRTFLSQPDFDVETRILERLENIDMRNADRYGRLIERLNAQDRSSSLASRESRKLFVSLRDLLEDQAEEIEQLRGELRALTEAVNDQKAESTDDQGASS